MYKRGRSEEGGEEATAQGGKEYLAQRCNVGNRRGGKKKKRALRGVLRFTNTPPWLSHTPKHPPPTPLPHRIEGEEEGHSGEKRIKSKLCQKNEVC